MECDPMVGRHIAVTGGLKQSRFTQIRCFDRCFERIYDARLMLGGWSSIIDPIQLAEKGARLSGELPVKGLSRLVEMCCNDEGSVRIDLQFEHDPVDDLRTLRGTIDARINVTCQRCMESMVLSLSAYPHLLLLRAGDRDELMEGGNALAVERPITLGSLIEDELLLSMPMVPMHPSENCRAQESRELLKLQEFAPNEKKRTKPFAVLAALKNAKR